MQDFDPLKWAGDGPDTGPALGDTPPEDYPFPDGRERRKGADAAEQLIPAEAVRVGVVGAPGSTDEVVVDIAADAAASSLVGRWIAVPFSQDDAPAIAVGQVTRVRMENDFRSIGAVRSAGSHGGVLPGGAADDLYQADITVTATFRCEVEGGRCHIVPSILGTVPPSGTEVFMVSDSMLERLLARNADDLFFLGHAWGGAPGGAPMLPTWIRHFQKGEGGAGDTYHLGIFGKTGAGKSVLAKMVMLGFARHQGTSLFVLDPQGEFSRDAGGTRSAHEGFALPWRDIIEQQTGKRLRVVPLRSLVLDTWELFQDVIGQGVLFRWLGYGKGEKRALAAEHLTAILRRERRTLPSLASREAFERVFEIVREEDFVKRIYVAEEAISRNIQRALDFWEDEEKREETYRVWRQVTALFDESRQGSVAVSELIRGVADPGKDQVVVLNLSRE
ncbi:MAG: DUF87 domain-containing protein, partial [Synergistales bacterium]|nr:DUF87 domain-containing protein [Synergistales bacterium]